MPKKGGRRSIGGADSLVSRLSEKIERIAGRCSFRHATFRELVGWFEDKAPLDGGELETTISPSYPLLQYIVSSFEGKLDLGRNRKIFVTVEKDILSDRDEGLKALASFPVKPPPGTPELFPSWKEDGLFTTILIRNLPSDLICQLGRVSCTLEFVFCEEGKLREAMIRASDLRGEGSCLRDFSDQPSIRENLSEQEVGDLLRIVAAHLMEKEMPPPQL